MVDTHAQKVWAERNAKSAARAEARHEKGDAHAHAVWQERREQRADRVAARLPELRAKRRAPLPLGSHKFSGAPSVVSPASRLDVIKSAAKNRNKKNRNKKH
jgi:hypothetical protein